MRAPARWWLEKPDGLSRLLQPIGAIYGAITAARMKQTGARASVPVICTGNFVAGGAGKTPTALALGKMLGSQGEKIAYLSRGFGGSLSDHTPVRVDVTKHQSAEVGDEPLLLAREAPTFICTDRAAGAQAAALAGASLIIMDDGMQNPSLEKDITLAVVDGEDGIGNGLCIPAGPLRAPLAAQWPHVDAMIVIGEGEAGDSLAQQAQQRGCLVLRAKLVPQNMDAIRDKYVYAFCGIGNPTKFFRTVRENGAIISTMQAFDDHHPYTREELEQIRKIADDGSDDPDIPVTTEKDAIRIPADALPSLFVLKVALEFDDAAPLLQLIAQKIKRG